MLYEEITGTWAEQIHRLKNKSWIDRYLYWRTTSQAMEGRLVEKKLATKRAAVLILINNTCIQDKILSYPLCKDKREDKKIKTKHFYREGAAFYMYTNVHTRTHYFSFIAGVGHSVGAGAAGVDDCWYACEKKLKKK
jgi:hypothetical protein